MRQDDGVRLRMRQIEAAAQRVAELVMQRHAHIAQHRAAQPGAVQRVAARADRRRRAAGRQAARQRGDASAIRLITGLASTAYKPSAACAMALMPLATDRSTGRLNDSCGSYKTVRGSTRGSVPVRLRPFRSRRRSASFHCPHRWSGWPGWAGCFPARSPCPARPWSRRPRRRRSPRRASGRTRARPAPLRSARIAARS